MSKVMTLDWVGVCFLVVGCPLIGGIPLTGWMTYFFTGKKLAELGTRNVGVSAAFYHGGTGVGILAVLLEAAKGIGVVWGARQWLPPDPVWELAALVALVAGRYWIGKGAGTTNVVWGIVAYRWPVALLVFVFSGGITAFAPDRRMGRWIVLMVLPLTIALQVQSLSETGMAIALSGLLAWIYTQLRDDLALTATEAQPDSQTVFEFLRNRTSALVPLERPLQPHKVGAKAATLSQLKRWGYAVPDGWVLPPGDDAEPLIRALNPTPDHSLAVRSSAIGEDSPQASAAGQYQTVLNVASRLALQRAIT
ncbi:MAG: glycerol-3-phosphate acyltransferase, partial [Thermosynechococcaceae cyanobacterium]